MFIVVAQKSHFVLNMLLESIDVSCLAIDILVLGLRKFIYLLLFEITFGSYIQGHQFDLHSKYSIYDLFLKIRNK